MIASPNDNKNKSTSSFLTLLLFLAAHLLTHSTALFGVTPDTESDKSLDNILPHGTFIWVDGRRASYVAAPVTPTTYLQYMEGKTITFGKVLKWHDGTICTRWELKPNHLYCALLEDPLLSDTQLRSQDTNSTAPLLNQGYDVICEGVSIGSLTDIDGRTLVVPMYNSTLNGLFEKPVDRTIMLEMARILKQRNFTSIQPDRILQQEFREAISSFVSHMGEFNLKFYRSPITWDVMDGLIHKPALRKQVGLDVPE